MAPAAAERMHMATDTEAAPAKGGRQPDPAVAEMRAELAALHKILAARESAATGAVVLTPEEKARQEWEAFVARDVEWRSKQQACPKCGAVPGYNPVTGIQVRSYIGKKEINGHRDSCPENTLNRPK